MPMCTVNPTQRPPESGWSGSGRVLGQQRGARIVPNGRVDWKGWLRQHALPDDREGVLWFLDAEGQNRGVNPEDSTAAIPIAAMKTGSRAG